MVVNVFGGGVVLVYSTHFYFLTTFEKYQTEWYGDINDWKQKNYPVIVHKTISVKYLWNLIMESTYNRAEPGVLFLDRANDLNPLYYGERIQATNPSMPAGTLVHTKTGIFPIEQLENKNFQVRIIKIFPLKKSNDANDYSIGIKLENLNTKEIKDTDYKTLIHYYHID
jgi:ribonucleotide reductase alpha subunit